MSLPANSIRLPGRWHALAVAATVLLPVASFAMDGASFPGGKDAGDAGQTRSAFIPVKRIATAPTLDPMSREWLGQPAATVTVYPQASVPPAVAHTAGVTVKVRAQYSAKTLALHLEWTDDEPSKERNVGRFADAAAVQWPLRHGPGVALPYIGMGHAGAPVALWFWRADGSVETLAAEGFGSLTRQTPDGVKARGAWKDGTWRVVYMRALAAAGEHRASLTPAKRGLVPVAFAIWRGDVAERNGLKRLSSWQVLRFEKGKTDAAYARQLAGAAPAGDTANGERLMSEKGCVACHGFPANPAQPRIGPDLTYAGGIHSASYLADSLREPSKVVVPGKGYFAEQNGKRVSLMPPFAGTEQERNDILAYLMGLRGAP